MARLTAEKLDQAKQLLESTDLGAWMMLVRETAGGSDPALPLVLEGGLTWNSALIVFRGGPKIAVVGNYDADPLIASGDWDEVIPYVQGLKEPFLQVLDKHLPAEYPQIGLNISPDDAMADGLSHGMYLLLEAMLDGTAHAGSLVSAADFVRRLRGIKTPGEVARMERAIAETERIFELAAGHARLGMSERELYDFIQAEMDRQGYGYGWDRAGNPIVNFGPHSMIGHGVPSADLKLERGQILHIDLGVVVDGYSSDIQRCWWVGEEVPAEVQRACNAVNAAITAGAAIMRPGAKGVEADAAARQTLQDHGYPEYLHALGHQVGRRAHDGGSVLGPAWERYGKTVHQPLEVHEVYTVELGVTLKDYGYLGLEEMVEVTEDGVRWMSGRQLDLRLLPL